MDNYTDIREQIFHNTVRENIIFLLLFALLYLVSFCVLGIYRRRDKEEYLSGDESDTIVYSISLYLSSFSLAVSTGAALLLPISILSNEILLLYPEHLYVNWLNSSLIQGLWNHVFLFSNLSLFILLPFAYLFTESEGFLGSRKGLWGRVQETFVVLVLLALLVLGMVYIVSALVDHVSPRQFHHVWGYYLPFLYSCISFVGAMLLLLCTPLGFVRLFSLAGQVLVKPQFLRDLHEEYATAKFEEESLRRRLEVATSSGKTYLSPAPMTPHGIYLPADEDSLHRVLLLQNGALQSGLKRIIAETEHEARLLDVQRHTGLLQRNVLYPVCMMLLFFVSFITVLMVGQNTIGLLVGVKALPLSTRQFTLGISSLSALGPWGAGLEIVLIVYLKVTSLAGLYTLPLVRGIKPRRAHTPLSHLIANCAFLLVLSSALPLISRTLGVTNFDLLGDFGQIEWLGNFQIVLLYNVLFFGAVSVCLITKFTTKVPQELYTRLKGFLVAIFGREGPSVHVANAQFKND